MDDIFSLWIILGFLAQLIGLVPATLKLIASYLAKKYFASFGSNLMMIAATASLIMVFFDFYFNNWLLPKLHRQDNFELIIYGKSAIYFLISISFALGLFLFVQQVIREGRQRKADNYL